MSRSLKAVLIAGEASGDQLGSHLIEGLRAETGGDLTLSGIGGPLMEEAGLPSLFPMSDLSVMGFSEVLPRLPLLLRRVREAADHVIAEAPDVLITIDSPDFCLRVAKRVKAVRPDLKTVHYVAPSVWAWRPGRAKKMARSIDHVLALLPFEPPYMTAAGMTCDFVGHPVASIAEVSGEEAHAFRAAHGVPETAPLLCLLPGSRGGEVRRHGEIFAEAARRCHARHPDLHVVLPLAGHVAEAGLDLAKTLSMPTILLDPRGQSGEAAQREKLAAFRAATGALAVSGTVSLELASQSTPMVIAWDTGRLSRAIIRRLFQLDTATLVNLVSETRAVPELFFENVTPEAILPLLEGVMTDRDQRALQMDAARVTMERLGRGGPDGGTRAARSVLAAIG